MDLIATQQSSLKALLISDDESDVVRTSSALAKFANNRWQLIHVNRLMDGINQLKQEDVSVVLLDLYLSDSRGTKTFRTLFAARPGVPIVVLTSLEDQVLGWHTTRCGAADHLLKGHLEGSLLPQVLNSAIELHQYKHPNFRTFQHTPDVDTGHPFDTLTSDAD